ncbi:hypothetical protein MSAR_33540 [Mycolicibacterium sarraceniae]|uniref:Uncharacterized protein n=1 Tax=Mycolicibacterium sarraceniae TaxID=1534348 RepID=A0A7I7STT3_9MYCO|nr:hypothetical protein MSAR_33540 [Mycolicibacterium sarraceniae]
MGRGRDGCGQRNGLRAMIGVLWLFFAGESYRAIAREVVMTDRGGGTWTITEKPGFQLTLVTD